MKLELKWERFLRLRQTWIGLLLVAIFWPLNWLLPDAAHPTAYLFFPLWLGYILTVDALVLARTGDSLLHRSPRNFILLFLASAPAWWLFEAINWRTQNWEYVGGDAFTPLEYNILSTISFSTVMPAVFESAELVSSFAWTDRFQRARRVPSSPALWTGSAILGLIWLGLTLLWPKFFYPLVWGAVFLIVEPLNARLGRRGIFYALDRGDWRPVISLSIGALLCGFFWEMWNFYSYPKWIYHTPGAEYLHVFEMPLAGYIGYLPFAWELHAMATLIVPQAASLRVGRAASQV